MAAQLLSIALQCAIARRAVVAAPQLSAPLAAARNQLLFATAASPVTATGREHDLHRRRCRAGRQSAAGPAAATRWRADVARSCCRRSLRAAAAPLGSTAGR